jgi:hypothetical protein
MRIFPLDRTSDSKHPVRIGLVGFGAVGVAKLLPWQEAADDRDTIVRFMKQNFEHMHSKWALLKKDCD